jgi:hypothetical protein
LTVKEEEEDIYTLRKTEEKSSSIGNTLNTIIEPKGTEN